MLPSDLLELWRDRAASLEPYAPAAAHAFRAAVVELEDALQSQELEILTLEEAEKLGGYSSDHLRREIRFGRIPNAGKKGAPRIRRADVPRKAGFVKVASPPRRAASSSGSRDRKAALSLETRR